MDTKMSQNTRLEVMAKKRARFTRAGKAHKNKIINEVVGLFGCERYDHPAVWPLVNALCKGPLNQWLNDFLSTLKLERKERGGSRMVRKYGPAVHAEEIFLRVAHVAELGRPHDRGPAAFERAANQPLVLADAIHVRRVENRHAQVERAVEGGDGFLVITRTVKFRHAHAAQPKGGDCQALPS
jgi:hypothetical protein